MYLVSYESDNELPAICFIIFSYLIFLRLNFFLSVFEQIVAGKVNNTNSFSLILWRKFSKAELTRHVE